MGCCWSSEKWEMVRAPEVASFVMYVPVMHHMGPGCVVRSAMSAPTEQMFRSAVVERVLSNGALKTWGNDRPIPASHALVGLDDKGHVVRVSISFADAQWIPITHLPPRTDRALCRLSTDHFLRAGFYDQDSADMDLAQFPHAYLFVCYTLPISPPN